MERYYTEKREKAEEQERYIREREAENKRLRTESDEAWNLAYETQLTYKQLQEALETVIEINARMAAVTTDQNAVGFCKRINEEAEQALKRSKPWRGGGADGRNL